MLHLDFSPAQSQFLYDFFITLGCAAPPMLAWREGRRQGFPAATWLVVLALVNGLMVIGARLGAFSAADWSALFASGQWYVETPKTVVGSAILGVLGYQLLRRWFRLPGTAADAIMLGMPLGAAIGRIGCLAAGCCYGVPSEGWWSIAFGPATSAFAAQAACGRIASDAAASLPLHPVQLDFILANTAIFLTLWHLRKKLLPGNLAYLAVALMAANRFGLEFLRDVATNRGETGHVLFGLKTVQWASLVMSAGSFWIFQKRQRLSLVPILAFAEQPVLRLASLVFPLSALLWAFRHRLSGLEMGLFWLAFAPALMAVLLEIWKMEQRHWARWPSVALLSGAVAVQVIAQADSLIVPQEPLTEAQEKGRTWWEFGAGYGQNAFRDYDATSTGGGCDGTPGTTTVNRDRNLQTQSFGVDGAFHHLNGNQHFSIGLRLATIQSETVSGFPQSAGRFGAAGFSLAYDGRIAGFSLGLMTVGNRAATLLGTAHLPAAPFTGGFWFGRRDNFFMDLQWRERQQYLLFPYPNFSVGILNWGFHDPTGQTWVRLGAARIGNESGENMVAAISSRFPIWQRRMSVEAGLYLGKHDQSALSFGLKYHLQR